MDVVTASTGRYRRLRTESAGGVAGNERLTALTGAVLLAGFTVGGFAVLSLRGLLTLHIFLGMLLIGPVALKISSTVYRFARYYSGAAPYVRKGPPAPLLRVPGPFTILTSVAVPGTGVALAVTGPGRGSWLLLHKASSVPWSGVMAIHVLAHAWRLPRILPGHPEGAARVRLRGEPARWPLAGAALLGGLLIAVLTIRLAPRGTPGWAAADMRAAGLPPAGRPSRPDGLADGFGG
jgi:hypothetical protein